MPWVRLADDFPDHPKLIAAGPLAGWLWACGLAYCNRYLTDGFVPAAQVRRLADVDDPASLAVKLVDVKLWEPVEGGYRVHDYGKYQPSRADVEHDRELAKERQARLRERRNGAERHGGSHGGSNGVSPGTPARPGPAINPARPVNTSPLPPPHAEGEGSRERRRRGSRNGTDEGVAAPAPRVVSAVTDGDRRRWERTRERLRGDMTAGNWSQLVEPLEPLGRLENGGLCLKAPHGGRAARVVHAVARALVDEGESLDAAKALTIVEDA